MTACFLLAYLWTVDYNRAMKSQKEKDVSHMKKNLLVLFMLLTVLLTACGAPEEPVQPTEPTAVETQAPTAPPPVDIGGTLVELDATGLNLAENAYELEMLLAAAPQLSAVSQIELGLMDLTFEQVEMIRTAFPNAQTGYSLGLFGQTVDANTEYLDLSSMALDQVQEVLARLPLLTGLQQINFVSEDGVCVFAIEDIPVLDEFRQLLPEVDFRVRFELFGQTVTSEDERIEYYLVSIGNEGVEQVRAVLPYLTSCQYLLMDGCDVDNEVMAQLREDFPQTKVVWRVWLVKPQYNSERLMRLASFLTDTHRIRTVAVTDKTSDVLKYCTETKYVDFGHNFEISDFSFLGYMPKLEAAIIGLTNCNDISMLVNCPELEYLEVYGSKVTDISALASCTKLKHLNISRMDIDDITCLYGLELERLRCVDTDVPKEQLEEYARLHPDCQMLLEGYAPHQNGWRYDDDGNKVPRYALLQEQMEYAIDAQYGIK